MQLAGLDQRRQHCPVFRPLVAAGKQRIFSIESDRAHAAFNGVGVDLDATIVEKAHQPVPAAQAIADGLGKRGSAGELDESFLEPSLQRFDEWLSPALTRVAALFGAGAADLGFDLIDFGDAFEGLGGDRRWRRFGVKVAT